MITLLFLYLVRSQRISFFVVTVSFCWCYCCCLLVGWFSPPVLLLGFVPSFLFFFLSDLLTADSALKWTTTREKKLEGKKAKGREERRSPPWVTINRRRVWEGKRKRSRQKMVRRPSWLCLLLTLFFFFLFADLCLYLPRSLCSLQRILFCASCFVQWQRPFPFFFFFSFFYVLTPFSPFFFECVTV